MDCILEKLIDIVCDVLEDDISSIDTHELGCTIDMIKDIAMAKYYCKSLKSIEEKSEEGFRDRMHYNHIAEDHIMDDIKKLLDSYNDMEKSNLKESLISFISDIE